MLHVYWISKKGVKELTGTNKFALVCQRCGSEGYIYVIDNGQSQNVTALACPKCDGSPNVIKRKLFK